MHRINYTKLTPEEILANLRTMRNCGVDYSAGPKGLRLGAVGAHARSRGTVRRDEVLQAEQGEVAR